MNRSGIVIGSVRETVAVESMNIPKKSARKMRERCAVDSRARV